VCSILLVHRQLVGCPVLVAANRDERLDRPATPPRAWPSEPFVAPRDEVAGGTWLGLTRSGMFVGVTNRFGVPKDEARASRGALVVEALRAPDAASLRASLEGLAATRFNAFHLLYADARDAFVSWCDGERIAHARLSPGVHVVTERSFRDAASPRPKELFGVHFGDDGAREARLRAAIAPLLVTATPPSAEAMQALLRVHDDVDPLAATCIHVPGFGYGTRSSMVLFGGDTLAASHLYWAEGAPCTAPFVERPELLAQLAAPAVPGARGQG
jgi:uncharacterized protein with NRDE domain